MIIATVKEIKTHKYRVGLTASCVKTYIKNNHTVIVEKNGAVAKFQNKL